MCATVDAAGNLVTFDPVPLKPETLDAYEAGLKSQFFDRRLRVNAALFYYDVKDPQVFQTKDAPQYRPAEITIKYTDLEGKTVEREAKDRLAICMQHELDHLDGVLYIDYLSRLKRDRVLKKFEKADRVAKRAS